jgi:hypothetical protein
VATRLSASICPGRRSCASPADASRIRLAMTYREPEAHPPLPSCQLAECRSYLGRVLNLRSVNTLFFNKSSKSQPFLISWQNLPMRQEAPKEID